MGAIFLDTDSVGIVDGVLPEGLLKLKDGGVRLIFGLGYVDGGCVDVVLAGGQAADGDYGGGQPDEIILKAYHIS